MTDNWADAVELEEQQNGPMDDYPPLGAEPKESKQPKGKAKKVKQTMSLRDFIAPSGGPVVRGPPTGKNILLHLPTGSRGKEEGDEQGGGMGGGFKEYGGGRGGCNQRRAV